MEGRKESRRSNEAGEGCWGPERAGSLVHAQKQCVCARCASLSKLRAPKGARTRTAAEGEQAVHERGDMTAYSQRREEGRVQYSGMVCRPSQAIQRVLLNHLESTRVLPGVVVVEFGESESMSGGEWKDSELELQLPSLSLSSL